MKNPSFLVEPYTDDELKKLEKTFRESKQYSPTLIGEFLRMRDLTILKVGSYNGLREMETLSLRWSNIDFENDKIYISPYSNKERQGTPSPLYKKTKRILSVWKEIFDQYIKSDFVFPSLATFEPISSSAYAKRLRSISKEANVYRIIWYTQSGQPLSNKRFNSARKYFGSKVYRGSNNPLLTMKSLRQKKLSSITPYVFASMNHIKEDIDKIFLND